MSSSRQRIVVIGGGIIGASIALRLAERGAAPIVLEKGPDAHAATRTSWAWLNASWGNPPPYVRLRKRCLAEWRALAERLPQLHVRFGGSLTYDLDEATLDRYVAERAETDYRVRLVTREQIRKLEPALRAAPDRAAFCEDEGAVEPVHATTVLLAEAEKHGAVQRRQTALGFRIEGCAAPACAPATARSSPPTP